MRLSAIRLPLSAGLYSRKQGDIHTSDFPPPICHPERSEGSRCKALVSLSLVNTGRREDIRLSDGRHQTYIHYSRMQEGSGAFGARVLWFVRFAPDHGLSPQSGPAQRGGKRFLRLTGLSPRGFLGLTAALLLRVVVAASPQVYTLPVGSNGGRL